MPWYPPAGGPYAGNVSFWYATYVVTGLGMYAVLPFPSSFAVVVLSSRLLLPHTSLRLFLAFDQSGLTRPSTPGATSLIGCAIYYWFWIDIMPKVSGYRIRQEVLFQGGAQNQSFVKVSVAGLAAWDAAHDAGGCQLSSPPPLRRTSVTPAGWWGWRGQGRRGAGDGGRREEQRWCLTKLVVVVVSDIGDWRLPG